LNWIEFKVNPIQIACNVIQYFHSNGINFYTINYFFPPIDHNMVMPKFDKNVNKCCLKFWYAWCFNVDLWTLCHQPKWDHLQGSKGYNFPKNILKALRGMPLKKSIVKKILLVPMWTQCHQPPSVKVWDVKGQIKGPIIKGKIGCSMGDSPCIFPWDEKANAFFHVTWRSKCELKC